MEERETTVTIKEGESAAINCKAHGKPPPTYSWIKASTREVSPELYSEEHNKVYIHILCCVAYLLYIIDLRS